MNSPAREGFCGALVHLFTVGSVIVVPVVTGKGDTATICLRHRDRLFRGKGVTAEAWYPGGTRVVTRECIVPKGKTIPGF